MTDDEDPPKVEKGVEAEFEAHFCPSCGSSGDKLLVAFGASVFAENVLCRECGVSFSLKVNAKVNW